MKSLLLSLTFLLLFSFPAVSQSFENAMELYRSEQFSEAADLFSQIDEDRAELYAGKSYLALSDYSNALFYLENAVESNLQTIRQEAMYTLALVHFGLKNFDQSLTLLFNLLNSDNRTGLRSESERFYRSILRYLSHNQRFELLYRLRSGQIRFDLVRESKPFLDPPSYRMMVSEVARLNGVSLQSPDIQNELLTGPGSFQNMPFQYPEAPEGTVYNVGVILPTFDEDDPDFTIPRNLYLGMTMAAEDFNTRNPDKKVRLIFRNSAVDADTAAHKLSELIWTEKIDAVIGPLFSEPAKSMAAIAEQYETLMLAPLANSDSLNLDYNYTFQLNPTFEVHGRTMAQFAVNQLRLDTLAIITDERSMGRSAALAFRHQAEELGAHISYYIEEDFAATGYDFSEITEVFTPNTVLIDSLNYLPSDAIYAPFSGQAAGTMVNLLMNNLEAMQSDVVILGSEEWEQADLSDNQLELFDIYYSRASRTPGSGEEIERFNEDYQSRFGTDPDRFSMIGYDAADMLFKRLNRAGNPVYARHAVRNGGDYEGFVFRAIFDGKRVNQHVFIRKREES
ncbi:MAG: ABC transporter substrate-binding protein [Bacteroidetes bacterium]|jgi:ABC-type branched-subunit amino acid transport system substrate-binding protein|nr:ABC transporter substrate-binding protein [Bacteroidota bacterium]